MPSLRTTQVVQVLLGPSIIGSWVHSYHSEIKKNPATLPTEKPGLLIETREVGRAKMYKLNLKHPVVKKFIELDNAIFDFYASQLEEQETAQDPGSSWLDPNVN